VEKNPLIPVQTKKLTVFSIEEQITGSMSMAYRNTMTIAKKRNLLVEITCNDCYDSNRGVLNQLGRSMKEGLRLLAQSSDQSTFDQTEGVIVEDYVNEEYNDESNVDYVIGKPVLLQVEEEIVDSLYQQNNFDDVEPI
jgi:hypothetical protein